MSEVSAPSVEILPDKCSEQRQGAAEGFPPRPSVADRRSSRRQRILLSGLIVNLESDAVVHCRAENASESGVRLRLADRTFVPPTFWLIAVTSGLAYRATIEWRRDDQIGVSIGEPIALDDPTTFTERRLNRIWMGRR